MGKIGIVTGVVLIMVLLAACTGKEVAQDQATGDILHKGWSEIEALAEGKEVNIFMWGGDDGINQYIDEMVAPRLKEEYSITLKRTPMDTGDILQKLLTEKRAGQDKGTMDIIWINGDNFRNAKENELLYTHFTKYLPNIQAYVDSENIHVHYDQGTEIEGLEAPWGSAQFTFFYDQEHIVSPPKTFSDLKSWMKENPGKFTYPNPNDFTGNGFLAHLLYESVGDPQTLLDLGYDEDYVNENAQDMWTYLNEIKPYLWREGDTYPESLEQLDQLYSQGDIWMTMGFNEARAESLIQNGVFSEKTRSFVLETGSIGSVHYLSIPFNSPEPAATLVAINFMLSPEAQLAKMDPAMWGESMVLDPNRLSEEDRQTLESIDRGSSVLSTDTLSESLVPEIDASYKKWIRESWMREVVQP